MYELPKDYLNVDNFKQPLLQIQAMCTNYFQQGDLDKTTHMVFYQIISGYLLAIQEEGINLPNYSIVAQEPQSCFEYIYLFIAAYNKHKNKLNFFSQAQSSDEHLEFTIRRTIYHAIYNQPYPQGEIMHRLSKFSSEKGEVDGDEGLFIFALALPFTHTLVLNLQNSKITSEGLSFLIDRLIKKADRVNLCAVNLSGNIITKKEIDQLQRLFLHFNGIKSLELSRCGITDDNYEFLTKILKKSNIRLCELDLSHNRLTRRSIEKFSTEDLLNLNLSGNFFEDTDAMQLISNLDPKCILLLNHCVISDKVLTSNDQNQYEDFDYSVLIDGIKPEDVTVLQTLSKKFEPTETDKLTEKEQEFLKQYNQELLYWAGLNNNIELIDHLIKNGVKLDFVIRCFKHFTTPNSNIRFLEPIVFVYSNLTSYFIKIDDQNKFKEFTTIALKYGLELNILLKQENHYSSRFLPLCHFLFSWTHLSMGEIFQTKSKETKYPLNFYSHAYNYIKLAIDNITKNNIIEENNEDKLIKYLIVLAKIINKMSFLDEINNIILILPFVESNLQLVHWLINYKLKYKKENLEKLAMICEEIGQTYFNLGKKSLDAGKSTEEWNFHTLAISYLAQAAKFIDFIIRSSLNRKAERQLANNYKLQSEYILNSSSLTNDYNFHKQAAQIYANGIAHHQDAIILLKKIDNFIPDKLLLSIHYMKLSNLYSRIVTTNTLDDPYKFFNLAEQTLSEHLEETRAKLMLAELQLIHRRSHNTLINNINLLNQIPDSERTSHSEVILANYHLALAIYYKKINGDLFIANIQTSIQILLSIQEERWQANEIISNAILKACKKRIRYYRNHYPSDLNQVKERTQEDLKGLLLHEQNLNVRASIDYMKNICDNIIQTLKEQLASNKIEPKKLPKIKKEKKSKEENPKKENTEDTKAIANIKPVIIGVKEKDKKNKELDTQIEQINENIRMEKEKRKEALKLMTAQNESYNKQSQDNNNNNTQPETTISTPPAASQEIPKQSTKPAAQAFSNQNPEEDIELHKLYGASKLDKENSKEQIKETSAVFERITRIKKFYDIIESPDLINEADLRKGAVVALYTLLQGFDATTGKKLFDCINNNRNNCIHQIHLLSAENLKIYIKDLIKCKPLVNVFETHGKFVITQETISVHPVSINLALKEKYDDKTSWINDANNLNNLIKKDKSNLMKILSVDFTLLAAITGLVLKLYERPFSDKFAKQPGLNKMIIAFKKQDSFCCLRHALAHQGDVTNKNNLPPELLPSKNFFDKRSELDYAYLSEILIKLSEELTKIMKAHANIEAHANIDDSYLQVTTSLAPKSKMSVQSKAFVPSFKLTLPPPNPAPLLPEAYTPSNPKNLT